MLAQQSQVLTVPDDVEVLQEEDSNIWLIVYTYSVNHMQDGEDWNIHTLEFELHSEDGGICFELLSHQVTPPLCSPYHFCDPPYHFCALLIIFVLS
jgi:hypothetical protein